ncbi:MAG TPA: hypothetical protein VFJ88_10175 [Chthoniobacterales bacterium]|jgi:hypothetical protein|nr:hypothetical protein [Chthoniobacterales bacterium]
MTTAFAEPLPPETASAARLLSLLVEPFLLVAVGLFWATVLPIAAISCFAVALYDRLVAFLESRRLVPGLGRPARSNPLLLRRAPRVTPRTAEEPHARHAA